MNTGLSVEVLGPDEGVRLRDAWQALVGRCLEPSVFNEPAFVLAAAEHLTPRHQPTLVAVWRRFPAGGSKLVGLCALVWRRWPWLSSARVWTHAQATAAFPLLDKHEPEEAFVALLDAVGALAGRPAALLLAGLDRAGPTASLIAANAERSCMLDERPRAVLVRGGAQAGLAAKGRKELRRQWNRLGEHGRVAFTSASEPGDVTAALDRFLGLEAKGWKGRRGTALGSQPGTRAFARAALRDLAAQRQCRIDGLEIDGSPLAMGIVLRSGDRAFFWKTAYDEAYARYSPGLQLATLLTERQLLDDVAATDSCAIPGHSMIDRIWPDRITVTDLFVATGQAPLDFDLICTLERQKRRLRAGLKSAISQWRGG